MDLSELDNLYEEALKTTAPAKLASGKYDATLVGAEMDTSSNGTPLVKWSLKTDSGHILRSDTFIPSKENVDGKPSINPYFIKELELLGVKPPPPLMKNLPKYLQDALDLRVNITVKYNDRGYPKVFFNSLLKPLNFEDRLDKDDVEEAAVDEIPF